MIKSFKHKGLQRFYETGNTSGIQANHKSKLRNILSALDQAITIEDLNFPGFVLHQLTGNKKGIWSIRVSGNWRITFKFTGTDVELVNYEDYH